MEYNEIACQKCGSELIRIDDTSYRCRYCNSVFEVDKIQEQIEALSQMFDAQKQENIANIRFDLWRKTHLPYVEREEISRLAKELKSYLPMDFFGNFYEIASLDQGMQLYRKQLCEFVDAIDVEKNYDDVHIVLDFLIKSLNESTETSVANLIERAYKEKDPDLYYSYSSAFKEESDKLHNGMYDPTIPRNIYISYAEEDVDKAIELVNFLENCNLSCFAAYRNLQRGAGSAHNYFEVIHKAIDHCDTIVFLSSNKSRSTQYDAIYDLEYIQKTDKKREKPINRIEYIIEEYIGEKQNLNEVKIKAFFKELTRTNSPEEVFQRIVFLAQKEMEEEENESKAKEPHVQQQQTIGITPDLLLMQQQILQGLMSKAQQPAQEDPSVKEVKYCKYCGMENPLKNRHCSDCGEGAFVATREEFIRGLKQSREELLEMARKEAEEKERSVRNNTAIYVPSPQRAEEAAASYVGSEDPRNRAGQGPRNRAGEDPRNRAGQPSRDRANPASIDDPRNRAGQDPRNRAGQSPRNRVAEEVTQPVGDPRNRAGQDPRNRVTPSMYHAPIAPKVTTQAVQVGQRIVIPPEIGKLTIRSNYSYKLGGVTVNCCAFLLNAEEKVLGESDFVFFNNPNSLNNSVRLVADPNIGADSLNINLGRIHYDVERIRVVYAVLTEDGRKVNLSMVKSIDLSLMIGDNIYTYSFVCGGREKSIIALDLYKYKNAWKINLIARSSSQEISEICKDLGVKTK